MEQRQSSCGKRCRPILNSMIYEIFYVTCVFLLVTLCAFRTWINEDAVEEGTYTYFTWSKGYLLLSFYFFVDLVVHGVVFRSKLFELKPAYKFELVLTAINSLLIIIYCLQMRND